MKIHIPLMRAYIAVSYNERKKMEPAVAAIKEVLQQFHIEPLVFVDLHHFTDTEEKKMMEEAFRAIDQCELLLAETTFKGIGIGVESGYAKGRGKPVIYLRQQEAEHSTTVAGLSEGQVIYQDPENLKVKLKQLLSDKFNLR